MGKANHNIDATAENVLDSVVNWGENSSNIDTDKLFAHGINFPANGKVHQLENLKAFKHRWEKEGLPAFQREVQKVLNIY